MAPDTKITPREDGPLVVQNPPILRDADGAVLETKEVTPLCRCGASQNKPFCDGSHRDIQFTSVSDGCERRDTPMSHSAQMDGRVVTIVYTPVLCSHAANCVAAAPTVFKPGETPWIQPQNGALPDILTGLKNCPSGALRIQTDDGEPQHLTEGTVSIDVVRHGPLEVRDVDLEAEFDVPGSTRAKYVLCRCGLSGNKPFCDGSHHDAEWRDGTEE